MVMHFSVCLTGQLLALGLTHVLSCPHTKERECSSDGSELVPTQQLYRDAF